MNDALEILSPKRGSLEHERLSSLINSMSDGVIAIDDQLKIAVYNGATLNILDINKSITNLSIAQVLQLINKDGHRVNLASLISKIKTQFSSQDLLLQYADGSKINLYISIAPVRLSYGQSGTKGHVILLRDITREKSLEDERTEFISVVSHELRTPVTIAEGNIGNAQLLVNRGADNSKISEALRLAHEQIILLADLINDLSTLSRAEQNKLNISIEGINVHQLLTDIANNHNPLANAKKLIVNLELAPNLEIINTSRMYLNEILQNFVTNAVKYTQKGSVTIGARPHKKGVEIYIRDTGIGISRNDQERIFDRFFRSEDYRTRETNGTGLGLYVTLKLAKILHAEINLQSELNVGSQFTIIVPNLNQEN